MAQAVEALDNLIREGRSNVVAKKGLVSALFAKRRRRKETERKKRYLKHYQKAGKHAMTYVQWIKEGEQPTYFKGMPKRKTAETRMREAGLTLKERSRFK